MMYTSFEQGGISDVELALYQPFEASRREVEKIHPENFSGKELFDIMSIFFATDIMLRLCLCIFATMAAWTVVELSLSILVTVFAGLSLLMLIPLRVMDTLHFNLVRKTAVFAKNYSDLSAQLDGLCKTYSQHSLHDIKVQDAYFVEQMRIRFGRVLSPYKIIRLCAASKYRDPTV